MSRKEEETQRNLTAPGHLVSRLLALVSRLLFLVSWLLLLDTFLIPYFVSRISYFVLGTSYKNEPFSPYLCIYFMGLTGFDSRCNHRARMQAGVCTA